MTLDLVVNAVPSSGPAAGLDLTIEETLTLQALWLHAERVDWAVYERLRMRVLAWPSAPAIVSLEAPVTDDNTP